MTWLQLQLQADPDTVAVLEQRMLATGAVAVTLQDNANQPVLEPGPGETPLWQHTRLTGLYQADTDMEAVLSHFPQQSPSGEPPRVEILEDKDWEREWMQHYQPMQFGQRLWICPSWTVPPQPDAVNLMLDPGLAFGTGTHPTTALCLEQVDAMALKDCTVVDYGCGSGILALASLKLGAARVLGIDNDPQALTASRDNAQRNGLRDNQFTLALPGQEDDAPWLGKADLVIANILAGPLAELAPRLCAFMRPGGTLMLSGLLQSQAAALCEHYSGYLTLSVAAERDGWVCLRGSH